MSYQNISHEITPTQMTEIMAAIDALNQRLSFAITLSPSEVQALFKVGPKSVDFVQEAYSVAVGFPAIIPPSLDVPEFQRDSRLFEQLGDILLQIGAVHEKVKQTYMAVGSEAMQSSLFVYKLAGASKDKVPGLRVAYERLQARFKGQGKKKKPVAADAE